MQPIEQACFWLARRAPRGHRPLEGDRDADVAVIGAGLTGLWTALFLKELEPALEVAVIEQGLAAYGASGRNAGMLSETVDHGHGLAIEHFGETEARRLAALGETNVAEMTAFLAERGIRCDYEPTGRLMVALTAAHVEEAERTVKTARRLGLDSFHLLDRSAVQAEVHSPLYLGGVAVTGGGILDPVKLVDGLRAEAERLGVRVYERSRATAIETAGAAARVRTEAGSVTARRARAGDERVHPPPSARHHPPVHSALRLHPGERSAHARAARRHRLAPAAGNHRRPHLLQLLPAHGRRPDPVGHERGGVLRGQPGRSLVRPLAGALRRAAGELPAALSRASPVWSFRMPGAGRSARPRG